MTELAEKASQKSMIKVTIEMIFKKIEKMLSLDKHCSQNLF